EPPRTPSAAVLVPAHRDSSLGQTNALAARTKCHRWTSPPRAVLALPPAAHHRPREVPRLRRRADLHTARLAPCRIARLWRKVAFRRWPATIQRSGRQVQRPFGRHLAPRRPHAIVTACFSTSTEA